MAVQDSAAVLLEADDSLAVAVNASGVCDYDSA
jgi:hypothetical protein